MSATQDSGDGQFISAVQDFARARINATRSVTVLMALESVQRVYGAVVTALNGAATEDKQKVLDTEIELDFGPFMLDGLFAAGTISSISLLQLNGWFICVKAPEPPAKSKKA